MITEETFFRPLSDLEGMTDEEKYICTAIVFSPDTEEQHFKGCPPYIKIESTDFFKPETYYFKIPEIVAYFASHHAGFTTKGIQNYKEQGADDLRNSILKTLGL